MLKTFNVSIQLVVNLTYGKVQFMIFIVRCNKELTSFYSKTIKLWKITQKSFHQRRRQRGIQGSGERGYGSL